jgi:hypothetical protein
VPEAYYNATCRLVEVASPASGTDALTRNHTTHEHPKLRCSLRQMSRREEVTVLGGVGVQTYMLRLVTSLHIQAGWRAEVRLDGETAEETYVVQEARRAAPTRTWSLVAQRAT